MAFSTLKLKPELLENLSSMGYNEMTPIQAQSLPPILAGQDVIGQGKTGSGKTAATVLGVDRKTFRGLGVPHIETGGRRYYTRAILRRWQTERTQAVCVDPPRADGKRSTSPGRNGSRGARDRRTGTTTSPSKIVDFAAHAGLRTRP